MAKAYQPKKKKYNDLLTLHDEMIREKVKSLTFDGVSIKTKQAKYTLVHGEVTVSENVST